MKYLKFIGFLIAIFSLTNCEKQKGKMIIDSVIALEITKTPDAVLRLFYLIRGTNSTTNMELTAPADITPFIREGFFVTEWGVVLLSEHYIF